MRLTFIYGLNYLPPGKVVLAKLFKRLIYHLTSQPPSKGREGKNFLNSSHSEPLLYHVQTPDGSGCGSRTD